MSLPIIIYVRGTMELRRNGFTIIEFTMSIAIMFIVIVAAFPIIFKKATTTKEAPKKAGLFVCSCLDSTNGECIFKPEKQYSQEFYTIQILGGGAGGGVGNNKKGGSSGEGKVVYYPSLPVSDNITYKIKLGEGGEAGKNGGQTTIYKMNGSNIKVLEFARGGITTNENAEEIDGIYNISGETSKYSENGCGRGGNSNQAGTMGEVIIRW